MRADAGVFEVVAGGAVARVKGEAFAQGLPVVADCDDHGEVVAIRDGRSGNEFVVLRFEAELNGIRAVSTNDGQLSVAWSERCSILGKESYFHKTLRREEELGIALEGRKEPSAIGSGLFLGVIATMIMIVMVTVFMIMAAVVRVESDRSAGGNHPWGD